MPAWRERPMAGLLPMRHLDRIVFCVLCLTLSVLSVSPSVPHRVHDGQLVPPHSPTGCVTDPCVHALP